MDVKKGHTFHKCVYAVLEFLCGWAFKLFTGFRSEKCRPKAKTFLLLSNHTVDLDPFYVILTIRRHARFVASANIMRGFPGCLVKWLVDPIPRYKGAPADDVTKAIKDNLAAGISVITFPEGNTTWDGETGFISKKVAQLVKDSGVSLVTYVNKGGYLKKPRWAIYGRKGRVWGQVVAEYSPQELAALSVDEIYGIIKRDLYVDAYAVQEEHHYRYRGKKRAEGLRGPLYLCPSCGRVGTLKSADNGLYCECGLNYFYSEEGWLENCRDEAPETSGEPSGDGEKLRKLPQKISVLEWSRKQKEYIKSHAEEYRASTQEPIFEDECLSFSENNGTERTALEEAPKIAFYGDRMEVGSKCFALSDISSMSVFRGKRVFFTCGELYCEMEFPEGFASQKYIAMWRICTGREYV